MNTRRITILLVTILLLSLTGASIAYARASSYLESYFVMLTPKEGENGRMIVSFWVQGTGIMDKIGADAIQIQRRSGSDWITEATYAGEDDPSLFYGTNVSQYRNEFNYYGTPNYDYRAVIYVYAGNSSGSDTGNHTSGSVTCKP